MLFSPGTVIANDQAQPAPAKSETQVQASPIPAPSPTPPVDAKALLDAINADRETRESRAKADQEATTYKKRLEEAEGKLAEIERAKKNRMLDPAGFLRKLGYTDRELALTSEGIMYSLMPDKAPTAHLANLVKAQREQDEADRIEREKAQETAAQKREAEAHTVREKEIEAHYHASLKREVVALQPGAFPAAQAWYADDHDGFAQELFDTARKLAEDAVKAGTVIDVSASSIAQHVEKKYAERAKRLAAAFSPQSPTTTPKPKTESQVPSQPEVEKTVVKGGANHKLTEREIIERATKAAFGL